MMRGELLDVYEIEDRSEQTDVIITDQKAPMRSISLEDESTVNDKVIVKTTFVEILEQVGDWISKYIFREAELPISQEEDLC
jgi:hypothetical protein